MAKSMRVWDGSSWQELSISLPQYATLNSPTFVGTVELPETTSIGSVLSTEIGHLSGVTDPLQNQLDLKANLESPTFTGTVILPSTTSIGTLTSIEIGFLDGITSSVQNQLNDRISRDQLDNENLLNIAGAL
jgi:hypothetical protein